MAVQGTRKNLKPAVRRTLELYGNEEIESMRVTRRPLSSKVKSLMNMIGIKQLAAGKQGTDALFHLFFVLKLRNGVTVVLEKNEDINMGLFRSSPIDESVELDFGVHRGGVKLVELVSNAVNRVPADRLFHYDAFTWNCQQFVLDVLQANGIHITEQQHAFIKQDVSQLAEPWQKRLTAFFTGLANRGKMAVQGEGHNDQ